MSALSATVGGMSVDELDEAVGLDNMSSDVDPGAGSGKLGSAVSATLHVSPVEDEQSHWSVVHQR